MRRDRRKAYASPDSAAGWFTPVRALLLLPVGLVLAGALAAGVSMGALMLIVAPEIDRTATVKFAQTAEKIAAVERGREWRLPTRSQSQELTTRSACGT